MYRYKNLHFRFLQTLVPVHLLLPNFSMLRKYDRKKLDTAYRKPKEQERKNNAGIGNS